MNENKNNLGLNNPNFKKTLFRYLAFWPYISVFVLISLFFSYIYLKYTNPVYSTQATIEVIDKAQDSEMSLPSAMTVFNRSMINLENEIGRLKSFDLNKEVVNSLKSNIKFFSIGDIQVTEHHIFEFFPDFDFTSLVDHTTINNEMSFLIDIDNDGLTITELDFSGDKIKTTNFNKFSTLQEKHNLPFELTINSPFSLKFDEITTKKIEFHDYRSTVDNFRQKIKFGQSQYDTGLKSSYSSGSDQISISMDYENKKIAEEYIATLINHFDKDGIIDRQLEYKRTIDFVNIRSVILENEVDLIEKRKQEFKKQNKLTDIKVDADKTINQQYIYDSELFRSQSQIGLLGLLKLELNKNKFSLIPVNFGLSDEYLNNSISQFNILINERNRYLDMGVGSNNIIIKNLENQIDDFYENILNSIENYEKSLNLNISKIVDKEKEFESYYSNIPENEKILRSIERELEVKEALYLLLLQKKEEASINNAVVKPTIKLIDSPRSSQMAISPNRNLVYVTGLLVGLIIPISILSLWFYFDDKIHNKEDIAKLNLPIISELPFVKDFSESSDLSQVNSSSRSLIVESIRMAIANLKFSFLKKEDSKSARTILVTSSIKGEGKTVISSNLAKVLSFTNKKVLLIGCDLRNPQLHKYLNVDKNVRGLSDAIYLEDSNWRDFIIKNDKLDILLSGTIPPNPTEILQSKNFFNLIDEFKKEYDYVIIDSAPCLLVADTFLISHIVDSTVLAIRANHSPKNLIDFISKASENDSGKLKNVSLILNSVGNSYSYGYKYGYGYKYQYSYNYGYGYGYSEVES